DKVFDIAGVNIKSSTEFSAQPKVQAKVNFRFLLPLEVRVGIPRLFNSTALFKAVFIAILRKAGFIRKRTCYAITYAKLQDVHLRKVEIPVQVHTQTNCREDTPLIIFTQLC